MNPPLLTPTVGHNKTKHHSEPRTYRPQHEPVSNNSNMASSVVSPFRNTYRYLQRQAHESPVLFYSVVLGFVGPVLAFGVPPIREHMGYRPPEPIPTTYPIPKRARRPVQGYEDEE